MKIKDYFKTTCLNKINDSAPLRSEVRMSEQTIKHEYVEVMYSRQLKIDCNFSLPVDANDEMHKAAEQSAEQFIFRRIYHEVIRELGEIQYMIDYSPRKETKAKVTALLEKLTKPSEQ